VTGGGAWKLGAAPVDTRVEADTYASAGVRIQAHCGSLQCEGASWSHAERRRAHEQGLPRQRGTALSSRRGQARS